MNTTWHVGGGMVNTTGTAMDVGMQTATGALDHAKYPHEHQYSRVHVSEDISTIIVILACYCGDMVDRKFTKGEAV